MITEKILIACNQKPARTGKFAQTTLNCFCRQQRSQENSRE